MSLVMCNIATSGNDNNNNSNINHNNDHDKSSVTIYRQVAVCRAPTLPSRPTKGSRWTSQTIPELIIFLPHSHVSLASRLDVQLLRSTAWKNSRVRHILIMVNSR
jgi:hypothetical protein